MTKVLNKTDDLLTLPLRLRFLKHFQPDREFEIVRQFIQKKKKKETSAFKGSDSELPFSNTPFLLASAAAEVSGQIL